MRVTVAVDGSGHVRSIPTLAGTPRRRPVSGPSADRSVLMSAPTDALPHPHRPGTARAAFVVPRLPEDVDRAVRVEHRHVDAELHAAGLHRRPHRVRRPSSALLVFTQLGPLLLLSIPGRRARRPVPAPPWLIVMQADAAGASRSCSPCSSAADCAAVVLFAARSASASATRSTRRRSRRSDAAARADRRDLAGAISLNSVMINGSRVHRPGARRGARRRRASTAPRSSSSTRSTYLFVIAAILVGCTIPDVARPTAPRWLARAA